MKRTSRRQPKAPHSSKRQAKTKSNVIPTHQCDNCAVKWKKNDASQSYFELECGNRHKLCPLCFSSLMASKGSMHFFHCPCCKNNGNKEKMTAWKVFAPEHTRNGGTRQKVETHVLTKPDLNLQPVLHHHSNNIMNPKKNKSAKRDITLSLSTSNADKEGNESLQAISLEIDSENIESTIDDKNKKKLVTIFQLLHLILVPTSRKEFHRKYIESFSCTNENERLFQIASLDSTSLFQCVYALSTGKIPPSESEVVEYESTQKKNKLTQIFAATEMIRSHCTPVQSGKKKESERGVLKNYIGKQLMVNCAPQALYRVLGQIGVSTTNETVRVDAIKDCKNKILEGYSLDGKKYNLFLILFDNLGFRVRGGKNNKVGYEQYTALEIVDVSKESLIEWGVYPNKKENKPGNF